MLSKVLLLAQPGLLSQSCTQQESLTGAAAPDRAVHLLTWDSQTARGTASPLNTQECASSGGHAEPAASWLSSPSPLRWQGVCPSRLPPPVPLPPSLAQAPLRPPWPSLPCSQGSPAHLRDCTAALASLIPTRRSAQPPRLTS